MIVAASLYKVIPDLFVHAAIQIGADRTQNYWDAGDLAHEVCLYVKGQRLTIDGQPVTEEIVFQWLSEMIPDAPRTIRYHRDVAKHYTGELETLREDYDVLPFSHFAFACQYPGHEQEILELSANQIESFHRPPAVDWLRRKMAERNVFAPEKANEPQPRAEDGVTENVHIYEASSPANHLEIESTLEPMIQLERVRMAERLLSLAKTYYAQLVDGIGVLGLDDIQRSHLVSSAEWPLLLFAQIVEQKENP